MGLFAKLAKKLEINEEEFQQALNEVQLEIINDLEKYRQEQKRLIDIEITEEKQKRQQEIINLEIQCAVEMGQHEHHYHHTMELRGIEIAKLEAKIEALKEMEGNDARCYKEIIKNKDAEIEYLKKLIDKMVDTAAHINEVKLTHTYKNYPTAMFNGSLPSLNNNQ